MLAADSMSLQEPSECPLERLPSTSTGHSRSRPRKRKWVRGVTTDSTHPPPRTFTGSATKIARTMARSDVSPRGLGSGIRMIQYFINRGGKTLRARRRAELERAKRILQRRAARRKSAAKKRYLVTLVRSNGRVQVLVEQCAHAVDLPGDGIDATNAPGAA